MISRLRTRKALTQKQRLERGNRVVVSIMLPTELVAEIDKVCRSFTLTRVSRSRWIEYAIRAVLGTALLLTIGCGGRLFKVDSRFTNAEVATLQSAADAWTAVGAPPIDLVFGQKFDEREGGTITRTTSRGAAMLSKLFLDPSVFATTRLHSLDGTRIIIAMDRLSEFPGSNLRAVAIHEFGHVQFGGDAGEHIPDPEAIMCEQPHVDEITAADVAALQARTQ